MQLRSYQLPIVTNLKLPFCSYSNVCKDKNIATIMDGATQGAQGLFSQTGFRYCMTM